ncbi:MAG: hypothetical protein A3G83_16010 [Betaproteobacteria bacterium RIFCSPLOWO2_12_FULL_68_20]|nr:MAG: hypothetical protein A3G83_16010 [Betaproteobacteria bacterium RIFCSPLOWO2_12_FULL_68_20]
MSLSGVVTAVGDTVTLTSAGNIEGDAADTAAYIAGAPTPNVVANALVAVAANGIGATSSSDQALVTQVTDLSARTTSNGSIRIYNVGATNLSGGAGAPYAVDAGTGSLTLVSTGAMTQAMAGAGALRAGSLTVVTVNSPGANIDLQNTQNDATSLRAFTCLALPGGCPPSALLSPKIGNDSNTGFANGSINYRNMGGIDLSGVGTLNNFYTFSAGSYTLTANPFAAQSITIEAAGNITIDLAQNLFKITDNPSNSLNFIAGGNVYYAPTSFTIGTPAQKFNNFLNLTAVGNVTLENSLYMNTQDLGLAAGQTINTPFQNLAGSPTGSVTMQGNYAVRTGGSVTITGKNFSLLGGDLTTAQPYAPMSLNGQELTAGGTINLLNSGIITVQAGTATANSASGARITGGTVNIGQAGGSNNPTQLVVQAGTNSIGYSSADPNDPLRELRQANATIKSGGGMNVYLRSDPNVPAGVAAEPFGGEYSLIIRGGSVTANNSGSNTLTVTSLGALQSKNLMLDTDGTILLEGGSATLQSTNALADATAVILAETSKKVTTHNDGSLILKGGTASVSGGSPLNARAMARLDPSLLTIDVDGAIVLQGGPGPSGSLTAARIDAGDEIKINVFGASRPYTAPGGTTLNGSFFMIGGTGSGFYDANNAPLGGNAFPEVFPITVTFSGGGFAKQIDSSLGDGVVQTGLSAFNESLLAYVIFAANEETRAARIRRGITGEELGAAACQ